MAYPISLNTSLILLKDADG